MAKRRVVLITDGDTVAQKTVEEVARKINGRCISASGGNPTPLTGKEIVELIKKTPYDPVLVMLDDRGNANQGAGESALEYIVKHPDIDVLGAVAVASNTEGTRGASVDLSISKEAKPVDGSVDKEGEKKPATQKKIMGDTVDVLNYLEIPLILGEGDIGKMGGADAVEKGAPVTTRAVEEILRRSGLHGNYGRKGTS